MKPVLFVTGHAPPDRVGAFAALHERETIEVALYGGRSLHGPSVPGTGVPGTGVPGGRRKPPGATPPAELPFPHRHVRQQETARLARSGSYRAVVCSTGGRVALPYTWAGARRGGVPLILWASLWAHPRSASHMLSYPALRALYRSADAVVTYGPHVSAYVRARGARNVHVAPQSVDNAFWSAPVTARPSDPAWPGEAKLKFVFAGRPDREKGVGALIRAWQRSDLHDYASSAALVLVGVGSSPPWVPPGGAVDLSHGVDSPCGVSLPGVGVDPPEVDLPSDRAGHRWRGWRQRAHRTGGQSRADRAETMRGPAGVSCIAPVSAERLREMYADADVLVVPSIRTRTFREPWGLVVNEAMNRGLATIASDAVGAVAGGLVRDGHNGLVVPAGDSGALADAMARLASDPELRARLGAAGARDVGAYTHEAWAAGFSEALATVGLSRTRC
ncbi:MAG TPA: glycosyltransferase family 4 protein [Solirubrobacteraceae bacterium]|jgi:glycosyltransferase involved in cell wall biosynthesis|nr:glycosyltransferase family 4 protein [Solirubrobacteraceae bacterium]